MEFYLVTLKTPQLTAIQVTNKTHISIPSNHIEVVPVNTYSKFPYKLKS